MEREDLIDPHKRTGGLDHTKGMRGLDTYTLNRRKENVEEEGPEKSGHCSEIDYFNLKQAI